MKGIFKAYAKINLFLDVLGKRRDGYHDIKSIVAPVSLADEIEVEEQRSGTELITEENVFFDGISWAIPLCNNGDNLIVKAIELFRKKTGIKKGLRVKLTKKIPIGAGLGGGSSDAATMLNVLNKIWNVGLSLSELSKIGAEIGCDVPAMLNDAPVIMEGKGDKISNILWKKGFSMWVVLVFPGFSISTADIYARWDEEKRANKQGKKYYALQLKGIEVGDFDLVGKGLYNALEVVAFKKYPILEILKKELEVAGANYVLLTGSGSVLFGLASDEGMAKSISRNLKKKAEVPLFVKVERVPPC